MVLLWLESIVRELATVKSLKADVLGLALRQSDWGSCGFCVRFYAENGAIPIGWEYGDEKTRINHYNIQSITLYKEVRFKRSECFFFPLITVISPVVSCISHILY